MPLSLVAMGTTLNGTVVATLLLPAASVTIPSWTVIVTVCISVVVAINVAVKTIPDPAHEDSEPLVVVTSINPKVVDVSLRVNVKLFVPAVCKMVTVGPTVSTAIVNGVATILLLPAASVNFPLATEITAVPAPDGVNMAI